MQIGVRKLSQANGIGFATWQEAGSVSAMLRDNECQIDP